MRERRSGRHPFGRRPAGRLDAVERRFQRHARHCGQDFDRPFAADVAAAARSSATGLGRRATRPRDDLGDLGGNLTRQDARAGSGAGRRALEARDEPGDEERIPAGALDERVDERGFGFDVRRLEDLDDVGAVETGEGDRRSITAQLRACGAHRLRHRLARADGGDHEGRPATGAGRRWASSSVDATSAQWRSSTTSTTGRTAAARSMMPFDPVEELGATGARVGRGHGGVRDRRDVEVDVDVEAGRDDPRDRPERRCVVAHDTACLPGIAARQVVEQLRPRPERGSVSVGPGPARGTRHLGVRCGARIRRSRWSCPRPRRLRRRSPHRRRVGRAAAALREALEGRCVADDRRSDPLLGHAQAYDRPGRAPRSPSVESADTDAATIRPMQDLNGKVAVITGGASGIGPPSPAVSRPKARGSSSATSRAGALDHAVAELRDVGRRGRRRRHRRHRSRADAGARRRRGRPLRRRPRVLQQRGRGRRRPVVGDAAVDVGVGDRRQPLGRHPRRAHLRAAADAADRGSHREHRLGRRARRGAVHGSVQREQARGRRDLGDAAPRARDDRAAREGVGAVPGLGEHRASPRARATGPTTCRRRPRADADGASLLRGFIEKGMPPDDVAAKVLDAIRDEQLLDPDARRRGRLLGRRREPAACVRSSRGRTRSSVFPI